MDEEEEEKGSSSVNGWMGHRAKHLHCIPFVPLSTLLACNYIGNDLRSHSSHHQPQTSPQGFQVTDL
jgi:hypothetical protein